MPARSSRVWRSVAISAASWAVSAGSLHPRPQRSISAHLCVTRPQPVLPNRETKTSGRHPVEDHRGAACASAIEMQAMSANVDQLARHRVGGRIGRFTQGLVSTPTAAKMSAAKTG